MAESSAPDGSAFSVYEALAPIYDDFTRRNDYEMWFGVLLPELEKHGLRKGRMLDAGCGTGRAFEPMLRRGWEIVGCDLSPGMLARARERFGERVPLHVADLCALPRFGEFELVWALNAVVNLLVGDGDLERAFAGMRANLAPSGLVLFDADTLLQFEALFSSGEAEEMGVGEWRWVGQAGGVEPGAVFEARLSGRGIEPQLLRHRHHPRERIAAAMEASGLELVAARGYQEADGVGSLVGPPREWRDARVIYVARAQS